MSDYDQVFSSIVLTLNDVKKKSKAEILEWRKSNELTIASLTKVRKVNVIGMTYYEDSRRISIDCDAGFFTFGVDPLSAARIISIFRKAMGSLTETSEGDLTGIPTVSISQTATSRASVQLRWGKQYVQVTLDPLKITLY
jgi:hypothetical protein